MVKKSDLKKLNSIMQEGNELKNLRKYNKAVEKYLEALAFVEERVKEPEERDDETTNIKSQIDQIYSVKIIDLSETAKKFIEKEDFNSAFSTYDEAVRIADKIEDNDVRDYEVNQINYLIKKTKIEESLYNAVLVKNKRILTTGYVGAPIGLPHCDESGHLLHDVINPDGIISKHCIRTVHAEQNAIVQAAMHGIFSGIQLSLFLHLLSFLHKQNMVQILHIE